MRQTDLAPVTIILNPNIKPSQFREFDELHLAHTDELMKLGIAQARLYFGAAMGVAPSADDLALIDALLDSTEKIERKQARPKYTIMFTSMAQRRRTVVAADLARIHASVTPVTTDGAPPIVATGESRNGDAPHATQDDARSLSEPPDEIISRRGRFPNKTVFRRDVGEAIRFVGLHRHPSAERVANQMNKWANDAERQEARYEGTSARALADAAQAYGYRDWNDAVSDLRREPNLP